MRNIAGSGTHMERSANVARKQLRLVQAWIELHRDELMADRARATSGELPYKIDPL